MLSAKEMQLVRKRDQNINIKYSVIYYNRPIEFEGCGAWVCGVWLGGGVKQLLCSLALFIAQLLGLWKETCYQHGYIDSVIVKVSYYKLIHLIVTNSCRSHVFDQCLKWQTSWRSNSCFSYGIFLDKMDETYHITTSLVLREEIFIEASRSHVMSYLFDEFVFLCGTLSKAFIKSQKIILMCLIHPVQVLITRKRCSFVELPIMALTGLSCEKVIIFPILHDEIPDNTLQ